MKQRFVFIFLVCLLLTEASRAAEVIIFDSRRPIAMSNTEKPAKDFYLNAGSEMGLKTGVILTVQRRVPLYNTVTNSSAGDLQLVVGKVKIIHVQNRLSVARLVNESKKEDTPILEDAFLLIGDHVDLGSASADAEGESSAKDTASFAPQEVPAKSEPKMESAPPVAPAVVTPPTPAAEVKENPPPQAAVVELKVETMPKPVIPDHKSVERQTATLDNPTLQ